MKKYTLLLACVSVLSFAMEVDDAKKIGLAPINIYFNDNDGSVHQNMVVQTNKNEMSDTDLSHTIQELEGGYYSSGDDSDELLQIDYPARPTLFINPHIVNSGGRWARKKVKMGENLRGLFEYDEKLESYIREELKKRAEKKPNKVECYQQEQSQLYEEQQKLSKRFTAIATKIAKKVNACAVIDVENCGFVYLDPACDITQLALDKLSKRYERAAQKMHAKVTNTAPEENLTAMQEINVNADYINAGPSTASSVPQTVETQVAIDDNQNTTSSTNQLVRGDNSELAFKVRALKQINTGSNVTEQIEKNDVVEESKNLQDMLKQAILDDSSEKIKEAIELGADINQLIGGKSYLSLAMVLKKENAREALIKLGLGSENDPQNFNQFLGKNNFEIALQIIKNNKDCALKWAPNRILEWVRTSSNPHYLPNYMILMNECISYGYDINEAWEKLPGCRWQEEFQKFLINCNADPNYVFSDIEQIEIVAREDKRKQQRLESLTKSRDRRGRKNKVAVSQTFLEPKLTPFLHGLKKHQDFKTLEFLLNSGSNINQAVVTVIADSYNRTVHKLATPLQFTVMNYLSILGKKNNSCLLKSNIQMINFLLQHNADVECIVNDESILQQLIIKGCTVALKLLVEAGLDINKTGKFNNTELTPLALAIQLKRSDMVELLLELGAS